MMIPTLLIRIFITVYNNWTQKENLTGPITESYCPIHSCCINDEKKLGEKRDVNYYNIGFLTHFYHLIGPTILHFLFPLPKLQSAQDVIRFIRSLVPPSATGLM